MTDALAPAAALAARMDKTATGAAADYLAARRDLLAEEIELRRHTERVAEMRRALPQGPVVDQDYVFRKVQADGRSETVRLSELFTNGSNSLVVYCYMFPRHTADTRAGAEAGELASLPVSQQPCPSCTGLLDQLDGAVPHFAAGGGNFAVVANAPAEHLAAVARDRGWRHLTLLSSTGNGFKKSFHAEDPDGQQEPMTLVFQRDPDGAIRLFWTSDLVWAESDPGQHHRAAGTIEPFWNMFDLTPGGRPDFDEQLQYPCCAGGQAMPTDVDRGHA